MIDLIRAPNHLGDFVLALPALGAAPQAAVLVAEPLVPLARLALPGRAVTSLHRGWRGLLDAAGHTRARRSERGVLLTPSFSSALLFRIAGVRERRGVEGDRRTLLLTEPVPANRLAGLHRSAEFIHLVTGQTPDSPPVPSLALNDDARAEWRRAAPEISGRFIGISPGSRASARRWDPIRFALIVERLTGAGHRVVVFGAEDERSLTALVAGRHATDLGGRCTLPALAAGLGECDLLFTSDSGPMHLAASVGTRTVSLWGAGDPGRTRPLGEGHHLLRHPELPCVPCVRNDCPRSGAGTLLPHAERECLALISVDQAWSAVVALLKTCGGGRR